MFLVYCLYHHWTRKENLNRYTYYVVENEPVKRKKEFKPYKGYCEIIKYAKIQDNLKWKYLNKRK